MNSNTCDPAWKFDKFEFFIKAAFHRLRSPAFNKIFLSPLHLLTAVNFCFTQTTDPGNFCSFAEFFIWIYAMADFSAIPQKDNRSIFREKVSKEERLHCKYRTYIFNDNESPRAGPAM
jgi:hypothetical protein